MISSFLKVTEAKQKISAKSAEGTREGRRQARGGDKRAMQSGGCREESYGEGNAAQREGGNGEEEKAEQRDRR